MILPSDPCWFYLPPPIPTPIGVAFKHRSHTLCTGLKPLFGSLTKVPGLHCTWCRVPIFRMMAGPPVLGKWPMMTHQHIFFLVGFPRTSRQFFPVSMVMAVSILPPVDLLNLPCHPSFSLAPGVSQCLRGGESATYYFMLVYKGYIFSVNVRILHVEQQWISDWISLHINSY